MHDSRPADPVESSSAALPQQQRVELILQQLDSLPTLNAIAVRVIELTSDEQSRSQQVIELVSADPALASRVLKLSRCTDRVRAKSITTIERAVLHLGFDAVRSAVMSIELFDFFDHLRSAGGELRDEEPVFEREAFWHHTLAVAVLAEKLVKHTRLSGTVSPGEAFLAGLLHDLGMLALHVLLPKSMDRVCRLAEVNGISIDQACARVIGITTHTAGKRLAERWRLPRSLGDVLWLHGQRYESLPELPHRDVIALISLADALARARYIAPVGHGGRGEHLEELCDVLELNPAVAEQAVAALPEDVADRASILGMDSTPDWDLVLRCVSRANQSLGRINASMRKQASLAQQQSAMLQTIARFHESRAPGDTVMCVLEKVVRSASEYLGSGFFAVLMQHDVDDPWRLIQFNGDGSVLRSEDITPPHGSTAIADLADSSHVTMQVMSMLPWLSDYLLDACEMRSVRLLPLRSGWGVSAVLLHDRPDPAGESPLHIDALSRTWAAAIAAGGQHEGARALGEELAEANRMLTETQEELARRKAMVCVGEIVAGAAHEMNNPLTVISGRSQQLLYKLKDSELHDAAEQIAQQSHRLSDMLSALREFTEPAKPNRQPVDLAALVVRLVQRFKPRGSKEFRIDTIVSEKLPLVYVDPDQIADALNELVRNAVESKGSRHIELRVQIEAADDRLRMQVRDDGAGLNPQALAHAFDPFFSSKPAGRQPGLGLSRAKRFVEAHEGRLTLDNAPSGGAVATIWLSDWRCQEERHRRQAVA